MIFLGIAVGIILSIGFYFILISPKIIDTEIENQQLKKTIQNYNCGEKCNAKPCHKRVKVIRGEHGKQI